jgi:hypothetical protein
MERIIIIDHADHKVYIEDLTDEKLAKYDGSEQDYIDDNYTFLGDYSWDYVTEVNYLIEDYDKDDSYFFTNIDFENLRYSELKEMGYYC